MQLPLVKSLAPRLQADCAGLESGNAPILEKVTPVTTDLLRWWFQQDCCDGRGVNFHEGQRQAILHAIYAHEILQPETLVDLYQKLAAEVLLTARRLEEVVQSRHPKYCLKMATGMGKTWVSEFISGQKSLRPSAFSALKMNLGPPGRADLEIGAPIWIRDRLEALSYVFSVHPPSLRFRLHLISARQVGAAGQRSKNLSLTVAGILHGVG